MASGGVCNVQDKNTKCIAHVRLVFLTYGEEIYLPEGGRRHTGSHLIKPV